MSMQLQVTIPPGVAPGQQMLVQNPYGGQVSVVVPAGVQPGQAILVQVPAPVPQPYYSAPQPPTESHRPAPRAPEPPRQPEPPSQMERQRTQQLARAQYQREVASRSAPPTTKTLSNPVMAMCSSSSGGLARCLPWTMVTTGTVQILERFGKYTMVAQPGCHALNPCLCDCVAAELSMRVQQLDAHCETKTKDNVFLALRIAVQYQVEASDVAVQAAHYRLSSPAKQIESRLFDALRTAVPRLSLDELFLAKEELGRHVEASLRASMAGLGYAILKTMITDIEVDAAVKAAMNRINFAARRKHAAADEGEAAKVFAIKAAEAEALATEIVAKAEAEARHLEGRGAARMNYEIMRGMSSATSGFGSSVDGSETKGIMDLMMINAHFEMMTDVGTADRRDGTRLVVDPSPAGLQGIVRAVQDGFIPGLPSGAPTVAVMGRPAGEGGVQPEGAARPAARVEGSKVEGGGLMALLGLGPRAPPPAAPAAPAAPIEAAGEARGAVPGEAKEAWGAAPHAPHGVEAGISAGVSGTGFEQSRPVSAGSGGSGGGSGMVVTSNTPALYEA